MTTTKAACFVEASRPPEILDVPQPTPVPGLILVAIAGQAIRNFDLHVLDHGIGIPGPLFARS